MAVAWCRHMASRTALGFRAHQVYSVPAKNMLNLFLSLLTALHAIKITQLNIIETNEMGVKKRELILWKLGWRV